MIYKISPDPSFPKRGTNEVPLWQRGIEGDFRMENTQAYIWEKIQ